MSVVCILHACMHTNCIYYIHVDDFNKYCSGCTAASPSYSDNSRTSKLIHFTQHIYACMCGLYVFQVSELPMTYNCHVCHTQQVTRVTYKPGTLTWIIVLVLCLLGLWPCCLIPLCIDGVKDVYHTCPNCNSEVGVCRRMK